MLPPPIPPPFFLPILPGGAGASASYYAAVVATAVRSWGVGAAGASTTVLAYVLVQHLWKHIPEWIREDESWQALVFANNHNPTRRRGANDDDDDNETADAAAPSMEELKFVDGEDC